MPQWSSSNNNANGAPTWNMRNGISGSNPVSNTQVANGYILYGNSTVGTWAPKMAVGVFGVDDRQASATPAATHAGWVLVKRGTGPVATITPVLAGANYVNGNIVTVSNGVTNAVGTIITNNTGNVSSVAFSSQSNGGSGFVNTTHSVVAISNSSGGTTSNGQGATFSITLGGRAGRVNMETLIAMGSIANGGLTGPYFAAI